MAKYYKKLSDPVTAAPVMSLPYIDSELGTHRIQAFSYSLIPQLIPGGGGWGAGVGELLRRRTLDLMIVGSIPGSSCRRTKIDPRMKY